MFMIHKNLKLGPKAFLQYGLHVSVRESRKNNKKKSIRTRTYNNIQPY